MVCCMLARSGRGGWPFSQSSGRGNPTSQLWSPRLHPWGLHPHPGNVPPTLPPPGPPPHSAFTSRCHHTHNGIQNPSHPLCLQRHQFFQRHPLFRRHSCTTKAGLTHPHTKVPPHTHTHTTPHRPTHLEYDSWQYLQLFGSSCVFVSFGTFLWLQDVDLGFHLQTSTATGFNSRVRGWKNKVEVEVAGQRGRSRSPRGRSAGLKAMLQVWAKGETPAAATWRLAHAMARIDDSDCGYAVARIADLVTFTTGSQKTCTRKLLEWLAETALNPMVQEIPHDRFCVHIFLQASLLCAEINGMAAKALLAPTWQATEWANRTRHVTDEDAASSSVGGAQAETAAPRRSLCSKTTREIRQHPRQAGCNSQSLSSLSILPRRTRTSSSSSSSSLSSPPSLTINMLPPF